MPAAKSGQAGWPNARDKDRQTALHIVAQRWTPWNLVVLLNAGADVDARDTDGRTALHIAAGKGLPEHITALLDAGASGSIKDERGHTPFYQARRNDRVTGIAASPIKLNTGDANAVSNQPQTAARSSHNRQWDAPVQRN